MPWKGWRAMGVGEGVGLEDSNVVSLERAKPMMECE